MENLEQSVTKFVKTTLTKISTLSEEIEALSSENKRLKEQLSKKSDQHVVLEKVAGEKEKLSEPAIKKLSKLLTLNSNLEEAQIDKVCQSVSKDPNLLVDVMDTVLEKSSAHLVDGRSIDFLKSNKPSRTDLDKIWEEALK